MSFDREVSQAEADRLKALIQEALQTPVLLIGPGVEIVAKPKRLTNKAAKSILWMSVFGALLCTSLGGWAGAVYLFIFCVEACAFVDELWPLRGTVKP